MVIIITVLSYLLSFIIKMITGSHFMFHARDWQVHLNNYLNKYYLPIDRLIIDLALDVGQIVGPLNYSPCDT